MAPSRVTPARSQKSPSDTADPASSSTPAEMDHRKRRRNRLSVSCVNCHQSKRMCDRKRPCSRCVQLGLTGLCIYEVDEKAAASGTQGHEENLRLRKRIAELESVVRELKQKPHPRWVAGLPERPEGWQSRSGQDKSVDSSSASSPGNPSEIPAPEPSAVVPLELHQPSINFQQPPSFVDLTELMTDNLFSPPGSDDTSIFYQQTPSSAPTIPVRPVARRAESSPTTFSSMAFGGGLTDRFMQRMVTESRATTTSHCTSCLGFTNPVCEACQNSATCILQGFCAHTINNTCQCHMRHPSSTHMGPSKEHFGQVLGSSYSSLPPDLSLFGQPSATFASEEVGMSPISEFPWHPSENGHMMGSDLLPWEASLQEALSNNNSSSTAQSTFHWP